MPEISSTDFSETDGSNNQASPDGFPEGMLPAGVNNSDRAVMGALKRFWGRIQGRYVTTGTGSAYVLTPDVAVAAYFTGERYSARAHADCGASPTIAISGLAAIDLQKATSAGLVDLEAGDIKNGQPFTFEYNGTVGIMTTQLATDASGGTVTSVATGVGLTGGPITSTGTIDFDVNNLSEDTNPDLQADYVAIYDTSGGDHNKVLLNKLGGAGLQMEYIPAAAMRPRISNGCGNLVVEEQTTNRPNRIYLPFNPSVVEHAQFHFTFPPRWDKSTIQFRPVWSTGHTGTDGCSWSLAAVSVQNSLGLDQVFGTPITVDDAALSGAWEQLRGNLSGAITIALTPGDGDTIFFEVAREVADGNDTISVDCGLLGIELYWTSDQGNDA